jgi:hypothetical protein
MDGSAGSTRSAGLFHLVIARLVALTWLSGYHLLEEVGQATRA